MNSNLQKFVDYLKANKIDNWRAEVDHPHCVLSEVFPERFKLVDGYLANKGDDEPLFLDELYDFFGLSKTDYNDLFLSCEVSEPSGGWHYPSQEEWIKLAERIGNEV